MNNQNGFQRPYTTVVLAMSVDGKISDIKRSPARFGSAQDKFHLEQQVADVDGVLFGAATLKAYGTTMRVSSPELLELRQQQGKPPQPVQIICSGSGRIEENIRFFKQPVPRWLLTTTAGEQQCQVKSEFERIIIAEATSADPTQPSGKINWKIAFQQLQDLGLNKLAILGGGQLVASLLDAHLIDEIWLTVCPVILGGETAPSPVDGQGFLSTAAPRLELLAVQTVGQEVFLNYKIIKTVISD